jgi:hypothetical protein
MNQQNGQKHRFTEEGIRQEIQQQPHLFAKLAENALTVAESLRNNYFKNTAQFVKALRLAIHQFEAGERTDPILKIEAVKDISWSDVKDEVVTFIDGGVGQVQISSQIPILLRVGSYSVKTGERQLAKREEFGYYPIILGDLEGGSKDRKDFTDIVRITAELLGGLSALERTPDLKLLMFHGPLVYTVWHYMGHTPFTEKDIDLFLNQYAENPQLAQQLKENFLEEAKIDIYPKMAPDRSDEWIRQRVFEPLAWMSFLLRELIKRAKIRSPSPMIVGVVERGTIFREFSETILLERVFQGLRRKNKEDYFNRIYGRSDLSSPRALLEKLGYTDTLLLAMLLQPGQFSESWVINKYGGFSRSEISLPGESFFSVANWNCLRPDNTMGFPRVRGLYVHVSDTTDPLRVEVFDELVTDQHIQDITQRVYLYARLLPGYGFPVGLDIVDKYAHVPTWMTDAYSKIIKYQLSSSLQRGEINDAEMRQILIQAIYMTKRDWLFRPQY